MNILKVNKINSDIYKNVIKNRNKIVKISTWSKNRNLPKSKSTNIFVYKKIQSSNIIEKFIL